MFFDGVTQELDNGRREDEIRLLQAYNKSELKKQIKQYPGNHTHVYIIFLLCSIFDDFLLRNFLVR